jgi:hypothetical protein
MAPTFNICVVLYRFDEGELHWKELRRSGLAIAFAYIFLLINFWNYTPEN